MSNLQSVEHKEPKKRRQEQTLVAAFKQFVIENDLVVAGDCHFDGDNDHAADVGLVLKTERWPSGMMSKIMLEAKSHHSSDAPNTRHKIFGQLLQEANKQRNSAYDGCCLGILIPMDRPKKKETGVPFKDGIEYYRKHFNTISTSVFNDFGVLVNARYVFVYSESLKILEVYDWSGFRENTPPISRIVHLELVDLAS